MGVKQAIQAVDRDFYVLQENGKLLTQTTATSGIERGLTMLEVKQGQKVLEIGTGSGFSTALLAELVGEQGGVVSIDIDPTLTQRAEKKLSSYSCVKCVTGDGREGLVSKAPYDRIIAWTTPNSIPQQWVQQLKEYGKLVSPFQVLTIANSTVTVQFQKVDGGLHGSKVSDEGYIPMTDEPVRDFFGYEVFADFRSEGKDPFWASAVWMKNHKNQKWLNHLFNTNTSFMDSPFQAEDIFRPYLLVKNPAGFTTAFHPDSGFWLGYSDLDGFALVSQHDSKQWIISDSKHADVLVQWWNDWKKVGKPSYEQLIPCVDGNQVKIKLKDQKGE